MKLSIRHRTEYRYSERVRHSTQYLRLTPRPSRRQRILDWHLDLPERAERASDGFDNILHVLTLDQPHQGIELTARGQVEITDEDSEDDDDRLSPLVFARVSPLTGADPALIDLAESHLSTPVLERLERLSERILADMPFTPGATDVASDAISAYQGGRGVCQDHTHVFLACCRVQGIPARYVSGYLYSDDSEHVASHAWAEVWQDGGWHTFDVTNQTRRPRHHLKLAVGLDYLDACPVRGVRYGGGVESLKAVARVRQSGADHQ
ncbi:transglutaminase family protein [Alloalcanivorax profundimaris]|uniref:transglutaminase family protein n=1 Tax=Alloalcanivorax profundimaris TaxID=2735259 RepID=UPI00188853F5|nr:transglutaminase family protein [Alloalcanivorax profundimaris]MBF1800553.1 transglutaminase family protein [Alloalcanivorax profundimaris]MCQ6262311.1 transglutaminase family protein [Alcanivorax sp. MM125-6]